MYSECILSPIHVLMSSSNNGSGCRFSTIRDTIISQQFVQFFAAIVYFYHLKRISKEIKIVKRGKSPSCG